ncbi:CYTH domain-containing protein [Flavobacterium sp. ASW18X]|uniref:CYTH domain-containing protein n=1 Tax=Flavobacterium sp. ASW18X TaxID=2572595 RepID=UPI0010ADEAF8|nr:CYTH domain-containing protein [Flavobacterium sp. ASW18X]TKD65233.1 CYTH domain-containing protein [Flavobacterium sp. ASW18X]
MEHLEIERKFLVLSDAYKTAARQKDRLVQGYLNTHPERTVRVRIMNDKAFITVKGPTNDAGTSRFEWEMNIPVEEATNLIDLCETGILEKYRYRVPVGNHIFEVDEFLGENKGLVVAEIELQHEDEKFTKPEWLGEEVTGNKAYYNSALTKKPFSQW